MKKIIISIISMIVMAIIICGAYVHWVRSKCIQYVEKEIIGSKDYYVEYITISPLPEEPDKMGWRVSISPRGVLDGSSSCFFKLNGEHVREPINQLDSSELNNE